MNLLPYYPFEMKHYVHTYVKTNHFSFMIFSSFQFTNAYGLLLLVQGISNLLGPPFAGYLYDKFKIWHYTFGIGGLCIVLSGTLLLILPCFRQAKLLHDQRKNSNNSQHEISNRVWKLWTLLCIYTFSKRISHAKW